MKGVPFLNKRYIKGVPQFSVKMIYKRVRGWTSGRGLPVLNFVKYPLPGCLPKKIRRDELIISANTRNRLDASHREVIWREFGLSL